MLGTAIAESASFSPGLYHWLVLSTLLFCIGIYGMLTRRNMVGILVSLEIVLNSAALNFVVFNRFSMPHDVDGQIMAIFIIAVAAAEVVVAMAIMVSLFRSLRTTDVTGFSDLRDRPKTPLAEPLPGQELRLGS